MWRDMSHVTPEKLSDNYFSLGWTGVPCGCKPLQIGNRGWRYYPEDWTKATEARVGVGYLIYLSVMTRPGGTVWADQSRHWLLRAGQDRDASSIRITHWQSSKFKLIYYGFQIIPYFRYSRYFMLSIDSRIAISIRRSPKFKRAEDKTGYPLDGVQSRLGCLQGKHWHSHERLKIESLSVQYIFLSLPTRGGSRVVRLTRRA